MPSAAPGTTGALSLCAEELNEGVSSILTNLLSYTSRSARVQGTGTGVRKALDKSKLALLSVKRQPRRLQRFPLVPGPRHLPAAPWLRAAARGAPRAGQRSCDSSTAGNGMPKRRIPPSVHAGGSPGFVQKSRDAADARRTQPHPDLGTQRG